jgi:inosine-uridine nucleoside N-ribohydrolase
MRLCLVPVMLLAAGVVCAEERLPVVLSTDVGNEVDDQWAIVYLLTQPRFDVQGILSPHAPTLSPPAGRTAYRILRSVVEDRLNMREHPPLLEGASLPLVDTRTPADSPAVDFLLRVSRDYNPDRRLNVLAIGAITDIASAILRDPSIVQRIRVVQMGFQSWAAGGNEFNIANDVHAVQVVLASGVPLTVGPGDVCKRDLALSLDQARTMVAGRGPVGDWLWTEFEAWYYRYVKPIRRNDFSKPWIIWDTIVLAHLLGMTQSEDYPRPVLRDDMTFDHPNTREKITWITHVDSRRMWADFLARLDAYQATHALAPAPVPGRLFFMLP